MDQERRYWFAAKRSGWGWGLPLTWQGWVVYTAWFAVLFAGIAKIGRGHPPVPHLIFVMAMILILLAICLWKGEPPRWRSGE
jgi:hypothetical protein